LRSNEEAFAVLLLDQVKEDRTENHKFERKWLEAKHNKAQAARLFESDDEDAIAWTATEAAQVEESKCKSVSKRDQN
jgi:hypothetical protein